MGGIATFSASSSAGESAWYDGFVALLGQGGGVEALLRQGGGVEALLGQGGGVEALMEQGGGVETLLGQILETFRYTQDFQNSKREKMSEAFLFFLLINFV